MRHSPPLFLLEHFSDTHSLFCQQVPVLRPHYYVDLFEEQKGEGMCGHSSAVSDFVGSQSGDNCLWVAFLVAAVLRECLPDRPSMSCRKCGYRFNWELKRGTDNNVCPVCTKKRGWNPVSIFLLSSLHPSPFSLLPSLSLRPSTNHRRTMM